MFIYEIDTNFSFGKYRGSNLLEVSKVNPSYIDYCIINMSTFAISQKAITTLTKTIRTCRLSQKAFAINMKKLKIAKADAFGKLVIKREVNAKAQPDNLPDL